MTKKLTFLAITVLLATSAAWGGTFLQVFEVNATVQEFVLTNGASADTFTVTAGAVNYQFAVPNALGTSIRSGTLTLNSTSSAAGSGPDINGNLLEGGFSGTGSILDIATGTIAISWVFGPTGNITVANLGTGGTFGDSTPGPSEVVFSSIYLNFSAATSESFAFALSGGSPVGSMNGNGRIASEQFSGVGTFDSVPLPFGSPEPATMAMLGSALVALGVLGRKRFLR